MLFGQKRSWHLYSAFAAKSGKAKIPFAKDLSALGPLWGRGEYTLANNSR